jgi:glutamate synthase domain-containing protein 1
MKGPSSIFPARRSFLDRPNPHEKDIGACGISGVIHRDRRRVSGEDIVRSIANMHDRGNGLGGGFAAYGIYPEWESFYCLHLMYDRADRTAETEAMIEKQLVVAHAEPIPTRATAAIPDHPSFRRYFVQPPPDRVAEPDADDYMVRLVMEINVQIEGSFVVSSGRNMGVFKGVGFPEEIAELFDVPSYEGYLWTAHNRFPTNTPGWWGGAHPFTMLDWSIVHNGEISSYGINKRYLEGFGYICTLMTDTEVVAYLMDLLVRRHGLDFEEACAVLAPPFWSAIDAMDEPAKTRCTELRRIYGAAALNGPFAFLFGFNGGLIGLNDRVKLRPLVVAEQGESVYMASEEAAIRVMCPDVDRSWAPVAGEPVITRVHQEAPV